MLLRGQLGFEKWSNIDPNSLNKEAQKQQILHFLGGLRSIFLMSILLLDFYHIKGFEMKLFINVHNTFVTLSSISQSDQKLAGSNQILISIMGKNLKKLKMRKTQIL